MESEDTVSYWLYPTTSHSIKCPITTLAKVCQLLSPFTSEWVWQKQCFRLKVVEEGEGAWCLSGTSCYADNVMDEWFIVSLIREATAEFPGLVGRVVDSDGEILLIEAADHIPGWAAEPSVASGRVFIHQGNVHIIPVCDHPGQVTPIPAVTPPPGVCAQVVSSYPHLTRASNKVQRVIMDRLDNMPRNMGNNHHICSVTVPCKVAKVLVKDRCMLAKMVEAVVERDPVDIRQARNMLKVKQEDMREVSIKFSKCLYAMLSSCKVRPSKGSGWVLKELKEELIGYKLAMGLEILLSRARDGDKGVIRGKDWDKFLSKLREVGYFKEELEGSQKYKELLVNAGSFWKDLNGDDENVDIREIVENVENDIDPCIGGIVGPPGVCDNEDWLEVTPDSLDKMLEAQFGVSKDSAGQNIPEEVTKFLNKMSDMAGVEHEEGMKFDPENLVDSMKKLMGEMESEQSGNMFSDSDTDTDDGDDDPIMMDYMQRLDREVTDNSKDNENMPDLDKPLDVDASVLSNLLASYSAQTGLGGHGPTSSLFQSIRVNPGRPDS